MSDSDDDYESPQESDYDEPRESKKRKASPGAESRKKKTKATDPRVVNLVQKFLPGCQVVTCEDWKSQMFRVTLDGDKDYSCTKCRVPSYVYYYVCMMRHQIVRALTCCGEKKVVFYGDESQQETCDELNATLESNAEELTESDSRVVDLLRKFDSDCRVESCEEIFPNIFKVKLMGEESRKCALLGSTHTGRKVYYIVNTARNTITQKCYDRQEPCKSGKVIVYAEKKEALKHADEFCGDSRGPDAAEEFVTTINKGRMVHSNGTVYFYEEDNAIWDIVNTSPAAIVGDLIYDETNIAMPISAANSIWSFVARRIKVPANEFDIHIDRISTHLFPTKDNTCVDLRTGEVIPRIKEHMFSFYQ